MRHYLITEYHERGPLADYLRGATLDVAAVVVLAQSAASGLAHLHLEVKGQTLEKPSIVHRNVSSKSFYVKNDGEGGRGGGEGRELLSKSYLELDIIVVYNNSIRYLLSW